MFCSIRTIRKTPLNFFCRPSLTYLNTDSSILNFKIYLYIHLVSKTLSSVLPPNLCFNTLWKMSFKCTIVAFDITPYNVIYIPTQKTQKKSTYNTIIPNRYEPIKTANKSRVNLSKYL